MGTRPPRRRPSWTRWQPRGVLPDADGTDAGHTRGGGSSTATSRHRVTARYRERGRRDGQDRLLSDNEGSQVYGILDAKIPDQVLGAAIFQEVSAYAVAGQVARSEVRNEVQVAPVVVPGTQSLHGKSPGIPL
jgi:hypothetical protein